jgi:hypothetical protein
MRKFSGYGAAFITCGIVFSLMQTLTSNTILELIGLGLGIVAGNWVFKKIVGKYPEGGSI